MKLAFGKLDGQANLFLIDGEEALGYSAPNISDQAVNLLIQRATQRDFDLQNEFGSTPAIPVSRLKFLPPIPAPEKIFCVGQNYADHAREMGASVGDVPVIFSKFNNSLIGHQGAICLPAISQQVDFEGELVVVIGRRGRHVSRTDAFDYVFGYTCGNDVSARDWQKGKPGGQWLLGKTFDTFAPLGPWVVTADEIDDPAACSIETRLNGKTMQSSNTSNLVFDIPYLIEHLSKFATLEAGDLIFTGTPPGVGVARDPQVFLQAGDDFEVEIEGIGRLNNPVTDDR